jgi:uncharacterized repeat protein (TIGR03803 family)
VTVAPVTLAYTETLLYTFCSAANCTDGSAPYGGLIQDAHGNLYGTTQSGGGANNAGTVFRVDNTGKETVLSPPLPSAGTVGCHRVALSRTLMATCMVRQLMEVLMV